MKNYFILRRQVIIRKGIKEESHSYLEKKIYFPFNKELKWHDFQRIAQKKFGTLLIVFKITLF